jgi:hypothetical protein
MSGLDFMLQNLFKSIGINPVELKAEVFARMEEFQKAVVSMDNSLRNIDARLNGLEIRLETIERALMSNFIAGEIPLEGDPDLKPQPMVLINGKTESENPKRRRN